MNRKRKESETYAEYKAALKAEAALTREYLKGSYIHVSKQYLPNGMPTPGRTYKK